MDIFRLIIHSFSFWPANLAGYQNLCQKMYLQRFVANPRTRERERERGGNLCRATWSPSVIKFHLPPPFHASSPLIVSSVLPSPPPSSYLYLSSGDPKTTTRRRRGQDWSPWKEERSRLPGSPTSSSPLGSMRLLPPLPATSAASSLRRLRYVQDFDFAVVPRYV